MEIEKETKKEKKKFSFFCCFSCNTGKRDNHLKSKNNNPTTVSTNVKQINSSQNNSKPEIKEFVLSSENGNSNNLKVNFNNKNNNSKEIKDNNIYSINSKNSTNTLNEKNKTFNKDNNININSLVLSENNMKNNKSVNENNMNKNKNKNNFEIKAQNIYDNNNDKKSGEFIEESDSMREIKKNESNKTNKERSNNNSENTIEQKIFEEKKDNVTNNGENILYERKSDEDIQDNVNIYDNNGSYKKEKLYTKKDNYTLNFNFKNNYNPTDLNLTSESKKNNPINSVINLEPRINLTCLKNSNFNSNKKINNSPIQNKDETIVIPSNETIEINNIYINEIVPKETKYKLKYSKSFNNLISKKLKKNNICNLSNDSIILNLNNRSGIFYINKSNSFETKIKFGFKYDKITINKFKIKQNNKEEIKSNNNNEINLKNSQKHNKSQNNEYFGLNTIESKGENLNDNDDKFIIFNHHILSKSQIEINQTEHKLNYIDDNYFKIKNNTNSNINNDINTNKNIDNNTNIIKEKNTETNISKINNNPINTEKENEKELTKKEELANNILDLEGEIEEVSMDEENKKINDSKSIMSNYIISPLINPKGDIKSGPQSIFSRADFNFNLREYKENISNFNEIMSNKGSILPQNNFNYNETEIEIMNENGKDYSSFIETPRASGVYNKRLKYKNSNYNINMNNTYNFKNMNIKMKKIRDKINQNAKEIQKTNEKINKLDEQIKGYKNFNKQYEEWIEKEEEESEMLINMINYLNRNTK